MSGTNFARTQPAIRYQNPAVLMPLLPNLPVVRQTIFGPLSQPATCGATPTLTNTNGEPKILFSSDVDSIDKRSRTQVPQLPLNEYRAALDRRAGALS